MGIVATVVMARSMLAANMDGRTCGASFLAAARAWVGLVAGFVHGILWCVVELVSALVGHFVC